EARQGGGFGPWAEARANGSVPPDNQRSNEQRHNHVDEQTTLLDTHWSKGRTVVQARWSSPWTKDTDPSAAPTTLMIPQANKPPSSTRDQLILPMTLFASTRALRCV